MANLVNGQVEPGFHTIQWATRGGAGENAEPGVYFLRMVARPIEGGETFRMVRRLIVIR